MGWAFNRDWALNRDNTVCIAGVILKFVAGLKKCLFSREIYPQKSAKIKLLEPWLSSGLFVDVRAWQLRAEWR